MSEKEALEDSKEFQRLERKAARLHKLFKLVKDKYESNVFPGDQQVLQKYLASLEGLWKLVGIVEVKYHRQLTSHGPLKPSDLEGWQKWIDFRSEVQSTLKVVKDSWKKHKHLEEQQRLQKLAQEKYDKHAGKLSDFRRHLETTKAHIQTFDLDSIDNEIQKSFEDACTWYKQDVIKPLAQIKANSKRCDDLRITLSDDVNRARRGLDEGFDYQTLLEDCKKLCEELEGTKLEFEIAKRSIEQRFTLAGAKSPEEREHLLKRFEEINKTPPRVASHFTLTH